MPAQLSLSFPLGTSAPPNVSWGKTKMQVWYESFWFLKEKRVHAQDCHSIKGAFHLFVVIYVSGFWDNSLGLLAPVKLSGTHKCWKTIKSFVPLQQFWKHFVLHYKYLPDVTRQLFQKNSAIKHSGDSFYECCTRWFLLSSFSSQAVFLNSSSYHSSLLLLWYFFIPNKYWNLQLMNNFRNWAEILWGNWKRSRFY